MSGGRGRSAAQVAAVQERRRKWLSTLEQWRASGLRAAEFCRQRDIQLWQLSWWKRKLEREQERVDQEQAASEWRHCRRRRRSATLARTEQTGRSAASTDASAFIEAVLVDAASRTRPSEFLEKAREPARRDVVYEIVLVNGRRLRVGTGFERSELGALLDVLEARS